MLFLKRENISEKQTAAHTLTKNELLSRFIVFYFGFVGK